MEVPCSRRQKTKADVGKMCVYIHVCGIRTYTVDADGLYLQCSKLDPYQQQSSTMVHIYSIFNVRMYEYLVTERTVAVAVRPEAAPPVGNSPTMIGVPPPLPTTTPPDWVGDRGTAWGVEQANFTTFRLKNIRMCV